MKSDEIIKIIYSYISSDNEHYVSMISDRDSILEVCDSLKNEYYIDEYDVDDKRQSNVFIITLVKTKGIYFIVEAYKEGYSLDVDTVIIDREYVEYINYEDIKGSNNINYFNTLEHDFDNLNIVENSSVEFENISDEDIIHELNFCLKELDSIHRELVRRYKMKINK